MAAIIECFEIFTGKQLNLKACSQMISSYKHNHTMEYLLGGIPREDFFFKRPERSGKVQVTNLSLCTVGSLVVCCLETSTEVLTYRNVLAYCVQRSNNVY